MNSTSSALARVTRRFDASPERVFDAWLEADCASRWLFTSPTSEGNSTDIDARVGGKWRITDRRDGADYTALGKYREIDRPRRLVFSFGMPQFSTGFDRITVEFAPDGAGCRLTLSQELLLADYAEATEAGWKQMFDQLAAVLSFRMPDNGCV